MHEPTIDVSHLLTRDVPLREYTYLRIGGPAQFFATPDDRDGVTRLAAWATSEGRSLRVLGGGSNVLELGCGSGAIALSLLYESESTRVVATDISAAAIRTASRNAVRYDLDSRMLFVCGDLLRPLREAAHFDMIISNPPYIRSGDLGALEPGVRDYEPRQALDGGVDGLTFYRRIAHDAAGLLSAGGQLFLEVGDDQSGEVMEILRESGTYVDVAARDDLNGIPRVVSARVRRN